MSESSVSLLMWLHRNRTWPPEFPRRGTLLTDDYGDPQTPREQWGVDEWRAYAVFLEESGKRLVRDMIRFEQELSDKRKNLSRRKLKAGPQESLLCLVDREKKKRGRKPNGQREKKAAEVLAIRAELEATCKKGKKITDKRALEEWFARKGLRRGRVNENRNILNAMSESRRNHNISKR